MRTQSLLYAAVLLSCSVSASAQESPTAPVAPSATIERAIDHYISAGFKAASVNPAAQLDDSMFARRLWLDLVGRIPTSSELQAYLDAKAPDKRAATIAGLQASLGYVRHQVAQFDVMMMPSNGGRREASIQNYLTQAVTENRGWDRIFRELMQPDQSEAARKGNTGPGEFLRSRLADADKLANEVSVLFFGVNVSCAQCHDHPLVEDWKQDHFFGMKTFLIRTYDAGGFVGEKEFGLVKFKPTKGPERKAAMMFLNGKPIEDPNVREATPDEAKAEREKDKSRGDKKATVAPAAPKSSARGKLVEIALNQPPESDYFSRNIVNRIWERMLGRGLVNPLDQMHSENKASHPELLDWLARDFRNHNYDIKRLIRGIALSQTYSRSSKWESESLPNPALFAVARLKPLTPMQYATSLKIAATDPESFARLKPEEFDKRMEGIEGSARGLAPMFAQPGEDFQVGVNEALLFSNSDRITREVIADNGLLSRLKELKDPAKQIPVLVRTIHNREATAAETEAIANYLARRNDRPVEALRQVIWALLAGAEFRFN